MKLAVFTVAVGDTGRQLHECSGPSQREYARRIGAEYVVIDRPSMAYPLGEKWHLSRLATHFDRSIYFDADVIVRPKACSLFKLVPRGRVGLFDELPFTPDASWIVREFGQIAAEQGWAPPAAPPREYYNTGLVVFDREHAGIWSPPERAFTPLFCAEQHMVNLRVAAAGHRVHGLNRKQHWQWWIDKGGAHRDDGQFLHFSGIRDSGLRLQQMRGCLDSAAYIKSPGCGCQKR